MTAGQLALETLAGLGNAMFLFLVASGLSLIFGVSRISSYERPSGDVSGEVKSMRAERPRDLLILAGGTDVQVQARGARA